MNSNFFLSASHFVIVLTGPITSVSLLRSSRPGTSIQYWKKYSSTPFVRLKRVRTEGFCPARRLMHFPRFRVAGTDGHPILSGLHKRATGSRQWKDGGPRG